MKSKIALLPLLIFLLAGCEVQQDYKKTSDLPTSAVVYKELGNNWAKFKLGNECFIYKRTCSGYACYMAISKCDCDEN